MAGKKRVSELVDGWEYTSYHLLSCRKCGAPDGGISLELTEGKRWRFRIAFDCKKCGYIYSKLSDAGYEARPTTINTAAQLSREYKQEIAPGVKGADIIQPLDKEGKPNYDFIERYGTDNYTPEQKQEIESKYGKES